MEGSPHSVLEGMLIGAYAIGTSQGYMSVRHEYPMAVEHLAQAIAAARELGLLGENILGSGFRFDIRMNRGSGAFICGEETALIASLEGRAGEPRPRRPFRHNRASGASPPSSTTWRPGRTSPPSFSRGPNGLPRSAPKRARGRRFFRSSAKWKTPGSWKCRWG